MPRTDWTPAEELEADVRAASGSREIIFLRAPGRVRMTGDLTSRAQSIAAAALRGGLRSDFEPDAVWDEIDLPAAIAVLSDALESDPVHSTRVMVPQRARSLAERFVELAGSKARFLTNGRAVNPGDATRNVTPLTTATADTGLVALSTDQALILWVVDNA